MYNKSFEKIKTDSISFVLKREKEKGGFAGTPLLPATIEDTYFAIKILNLLNFPVNEKHKTFLLTQKINTLSLYPLALLLKLLKRLFLLEALNKSSFEFIIRFLQQKNEKQKSFLKDYKALSEIFKILDLKDEISYLKSKILKILNLDELKIKTVRDVYFLGKIFQNCEIPKDYFLKDYLELILNAQNSDGGFGFFKGTTSYLENAYYACYVLFYHNLKPKNFENLINFVLSCQNEDGGWGRNSQGISFWETTYYALWILKNSNLLK